MLSHGCEDDVAALPADATDEKEDKNIQEDTTDMNINEEEDEGSSVLSVPRQNNMSTKKKLAIGLLSLAMVAVVALSVGLTVSNNKNKNKNKNQQPTVAQSKQQSLANCLAQPEYADYSIIEKEVPTTSTVDDEEDDDEATNSPTTPFLSNDFDTDPLLVYTDDRMGGEILTFGDDSGQKKRKLQDEGVSSSGYMKDGKKKELLRSRLPRSMEERVRKRTFLVVLYPIYIHWCVCVFIDSANTYLFRIV